MKILQVCNKPPFPPLDGGSVAISNLARSLSLLGNDVTVLTMQTPKHNYCNYASMDSPENIEVHCVFVDTSIRAHKLLMNLFFSRLPYNAVRFFSADFRNKLISLLQSDNYDVVQLEGLYLTPYISDVRKHSRSLIALRAHNVEHEIWDGIARNENNPLKKLYYKLLANRIRRFESRIINRYDLLVPISEHDFTQYRLMGNTRPVQICPAGFTINADHAALVKTHLETAFNSMWPCTLFYLGSLDWIPNLEGLLWFIINIFPELRRRNPGLLFNVAGRNTPKELMKSMDIPGLVFHGEIDNAFEFILSNSILVAPCFSGSGLRIKIIEAMAFGKPVITTPKGAEGLEVSNGENIIIATSAEEYIQQIEKLLNHVDFYRRIGQNAYSLIAGKYNSVSIAENLASFYMLNLK